MFWDLPLDDFSGAFCGQGKYPLIGAVSKELGGYTPIPHTPGPKPTTKAGGEDTTTTPHNSNSSHERMPCYWKMEGW